MPMDVVVSHRGDQLVVGLAAGSATVAALKEELFKRTGIEPENQQLLHKGSKLAGGGELAAAGLQAGKRNKLVLVGSSSSTLDAARAGNRKQEALQAARAEAKQAERVRRFMAERSGGGSGGGGGGGGGGPRGEWMFEKLRVLDGPAFTTPPPAAAMELLRRLSEDRGVLAVMAKYMWAVALLKEFPPSDGKVGVDNACLLGYNKKTPGPQRRSNEIGLRLRTDALDGLRPYEVIRKTLIHELAHMEHDDHNVQFHELNSKLTRESHQLDWNRGGGRAVGEGAGLRVGSRTELLGTGAEEWETEVSSPPRLAAS
eukprot:SAG22_NODE_4569_length_1231_cov_1.628975_1_plen_314_part_00